MAMQQQQPQQQPGNSFTSQFAGMSKAQLYDIMSQMKTLIEQNQEQARQILIDNPLLTRALFQAQIMLGMVQPPKMMPNIQQPLSQSQPAQVGQPPTVPSSQTLSVQVGAQSEPSSSQTLPPARQQHPTQPSISVPLPSVPMTFLSQAMPAPFSAQAKSFLNVQVPPVPPLPSSQIPNISLPSPAPPHYSTLPSHMPMAAVLQQQVLQNPGVFNQSLQPPLPLQPRPPVAMPPFTHQFHLQLPHSLGLQPSSGPQQLLLQPLFHSGITPPSSFPQGQPPLPSQPPPQHLYQVGSSRIGSDYGIQAGTSTQTDRGTPWGPPEITAATQLPGPPPMVSGQMATSTSGQPPRPPPLRPEMEKALLQQVMSLTPEQINLLPPEQRHQVLQLQEMLK